jgi:hypothetical protein
MTPARSFPLLLVVSAKRRVIPRYVFARFLGRRDISEVITGNASEDGELHFQSTLSAGHAGKTADARLTFDPDHSVGADHGR